MNDRLRNGNRWIHSLAQEVSRMIWAFASDDDRREVVRDLADRVEKELTNAAWRPASDPPPMSEHCFEYYTSEPVLGYSPSGKIQVVTYKQLDSESPPEWFSNCSEEWNLGDTVTHWMPLPPKPENLEGQVNE